MTLIDTHAHLDQEEFDADRATLIERAHAAGVESIIAIGVTAHSRAAVASLAAEAGRVRRRRNSPNYSPQRCRQIGIASSACHGAGQVVALGETGLDLYRDYAPLALQQDYFDRHLRLSQQTGLPLVVHTHRARPRCWPCSTRRHAAVRWRA